MNNFQKMYLITFGFVLSIILLFNIISDEFDWNLFDFIILFIMMIFAGASFEFVSRIIKNEKNQKILFVIIIFSFRITLSSICVSGFFSIKFTNSSHVSKFIPLNS